MLNNTILQVSRMVIMFGTGSIPRLRIEEMHNQTKTDAHGVAEA